MPNQLGKLKQGFWFLKFRSRCTYVLRKGHQPKPKMVGNFMNVIFMQSIRCLNIYLICIFLATSCIARLCALEKGGVLCHLQLQMVCIFQAFKCF